MRTLINILLASFVISILGCESEVASEEASLTFSPSGLEDLGPDYVYEGWLIVDDAPVSAGRFTIDAEGNPNPAVIMVDAEMAAAATLYVLTIEPAEGDDPAPSDVHVLAGPIENDRAELTIGHEAAVGTDFADAAGEFILETPSSAATDDPENGIWWLRPTADGMEAGLTLPQLPNGWIYEGWIVNADGPVSTGRFSMPDQADDDGAGPAGGSEPSPPFPGQDFVDPARVLTSGYAAVISVEPVPDNSPAPFAIKPLIDTMMESVTAPDTQPMVNTASDEAPSAVLDIAMN